MKQRENAIAIFNAAVAAVQPGQLLPVHLRIASDTLYIFDQQFPVSELQHIYVIGAGKASAAMAKTTEDILGDLITSGLVVTKYEHAVPLQKIGWREAAHPVPDENGIDATKETIRLLQRAGAQDIIICLLSGGASALWIDMPPGATLQDLQATYDLLIKSGASIDEMNTVRKHLSAIKGGQLLQYAPKAKWYCFILSDVPGDDLPVIGCGPTVPDATTFADVKRILDMYSLLNRLPGAIRMHINAGVSQIIPDGSRRRDPVFSSVHNKIIGNNSTALNAAVDKAIQSGYCIAAVNSSLRGDAATVAKAMIQACGSYTGPLPACWLSGGETTVVVNGDGKGGRNQQMALSALEQLLLYELNDTLHCITFLAAGTDGTDGPTDAAGAIADSESISLTKEKKLDPAMYLGRNDAYYFFEQTNGLLKTGPTQTNVMDLVVIIKE